MLFDIAFLQEFIRREVKPKSKAQLVNGILEFWRSVTVSKCQRYICHLRRVIPKIIEVNGDPTGY